MNKKIFKLPPSSFFLIGISIALFSYLTKGTFEPFSLLAFILMGIFEIFFRRQTRIPSNLLSFISAFLLVFIIKIYVIDFKVVKRDIPEFGIKNNARIFYRPSMFKLALGDLIIYIPQGDVKYYIATLKNIRDNLYEIDPPSKANPEGIVKKQIKGKIVFVSQK